MYGRAASPVMTPGANPATFPPMDRDLIGYGANPPNPNWLAQP
jgi:hypothetical protein